MIVSCALLDRIVRLHLLAGEIFGSAISNFADYRETIASNDEEIIIRA
jgi:hypothetical protein